MNQQGAKKTSLRELPKISDRVSYIYIEHAKINRQDSAITVLTDKGMVKIPAAMIGILMLGPGTDITHRAVELIGDTGTCIVWVGERGVRNYANARPLAHSTKLLEQQAKLFSNTKSRLRVARNMYQMRYRDENPNALTMQQLRGREGARVRQIYRLYSKKYKVEWDGREYEVDDYESGTAVNKALSSANVSLYGLVHSITVALGMSPGLGFVHQGHDRAFVYDIADLYKAEYTIPLSFQIAAEYGDTEDVGTIARQKLRDKIAEGKLMPQIVKDIQYLMEIEAEEQIEIESMSLWDEKAEKVEYGVNYSEE